MSESVLFKSYKFGNITLNNRMVMAPVTRCRANNDGNVATALTTKYYAQRATAGLIITEGTFISRKAVGFINVLGIYTEAQTEGWKLVTEVVHEKDGKIVVQLWHTGRLSHPDLVNRFRTNASLNKPDQNTFCTSTEKGYTDYPEIVG